MSLRKPCGVWSIFSRLLCSLFHWPWHEIAQDRIPDGFADWRQVVLCHRCRRRWERIK